MRYCATRIFNANKKDRGIVLNRIDQVIGLAHACDLADDEPTTLQYAPQFEIGFGTRDSVDDPFDL